MACAAMASPARCSHSSAVVAVAAVVVFGAAVGERSADAVRPGEWPGGCRTVVLLALGARPVPPVLATAASWMYAVGWAARLRER